MKDAFRAVFRGAAAFRRRSAERFPDSAKQNMAVAEYLDRLADTVEDCPVDLLKQAYRTDYRIQLRQTGLKFFPKDAAHFCREAIARDA